MAFKLTKKPTFSVQVEVYTPNDRRGHDYSTFTAVFHRTQTSELIELKNLPQVDVMRKKLCGWEDFNDENNEPVPYNQDTLEMLLSVPEALHGLSVAFWENVIKAREKN